MADRSARQPRRHPRVLRLRHLRRVRQGHRASGVPGHRSDRLADPVVRDLRGRLPRAADWRDRPGALRRSSRPPRRLPVVGVHHVGRDARHGPGADLRAVGRCGQPADGHVAVDPGVLPRRRTARRADLRGRDRAAHRAVRLRRGVRVRDDGCGGGHRREPVGAHLHGSGAGTCLRMADRVHPWRPRRRVEFRPPPIARRVAGVRAHAQPGRASTIPRAAQDQPRAMSSSAARCWPAPAASTGCSSRISRRTCPACCSTTRARRCCRRPSA